MGASASVGLVYKQALDWFRLYLDADTYQEDFASIDKDHDGFIELNELHQWISERSNEDETWKIFVNNPQVIPLAVKFACSHQHGVSKIVDVSEFRELLVHLFATSVLWLHFKNAYGWKSGCGRETGEEGKNKLNLEKFRLAYKTICKAYAKENVSDEQIVEDFELLDKNGFGFLGFTELCSYCSTFIDCNGKGNEELGGSRMGSPRYKKFFGTSPNYRHEDVLKELEAGPKMYYDSLTVPEKTKAAVDSLARRLESEAALVAQVTEETKPLARLREETGLLQHPERTTRSLLSDAKAKDSFLEFAKSCFLEENVLFYLELDHLKQSRKLWVEQASNLHRVFIAAGSPREVNISDAMKHAIAVAVEEEVQREQTTELLQALEKAQHEIITLLANNVLSRYLASLYYENWRQSPEAESVINGILKS